MRSAFCAQTETANKVWVTYLLFLDTLDVLHLDLCDFINVLDGNRTCYLRPGFARTRLDSCRSLQQ